MKTVSDFRILPELKIIIEIASGKITLQDIIELKSKEIKHQDYNPCFNFIVDVTNADLSLSEEEIDEYIKFAQKNIDIIGKRKSAIMTYTPSQVVFGTLYKVATYKFPINFKIVSTVETALSWVGLSSEHKAIVEDTIKDIMRPNI